MSRDLDDIDQRILSRLQQDARNSTAQEIADKVGVSASTVRNRIALLESDGIIRGYYPEIDYEEANIPLKMTFVLSVPPTEMADYSERVRQIPGVVDLREMVTGRRNLYVDVVTGDSPQLTRITDEIHDLGIEIESSELMRRRRVQPFNFFLERTETDRSRDDTQKITDNE